MMTDIGNSRIAHERARQPGDQDGKRENERKQVQGLKQEHEHEQDPKEVPQ